MTISTEAIKSALSALIDPVTGTDYVSGKMFKSAETDENGNVKQRPHSVASRQAPCRSRRSGRGRGRPRRRCRLR